MANNTTPTHRFKVGDRVRYTGDSPWAQGVTGTIERLFGAYWATYEDEETGDSVRTWMPPKYSVKIDAVPDTTGTQVPRWPYREKDGSPRPYFAPADKDLELI